jgi:hypothetical protein
MSVGSGGCWFGPITVICADAVSPLPASVEVTALVTLFCAPAVVPITFTAKVHAASPTRVVPDRLTLLEPAAAVIVPFPQVPVSPFGVATVSPVGKVSVKPMPLKDDPELGFDRLKVKEMLPFRATLAAPNCFATVGGSNVGGGLLPDPPPQPTLQKRPTIQRTSDSWCNTFLRLLAIPLSPLLLVALRSIVRRYARPPVHLAVELRHLFFGLLDFLKQVHFLLGFARHV